MTSTGFRRLLFPLACAFLMTLTAAVPIRGATDPAHVLEQIGLLRGICVVLGDPSGQWAMDLARHSEFLVYVQLPDASAVAQARAAAEQAKLGASRLQIELGNPQQIHLADNLADAVVVLDATATTPEAEILRIVRPRGKLVRGDNSVVVKPVPPGTDDWTHPYHGPDNNPQSQDTRITAPYMTQFLADPRYGPAPQVAIAAGGRVFKAFGNVAWHEREEAFLDTLVAYDGYNGTMLWKYKLPEGMMVHRNVFIATPDIVYVGDDKSCKRLHAATGELLDEIIPPVAVAGGTFWKWMALEGDTLYALIGEKELNDGEVRWKSTSHGWPWEAISRGYNTPDQPWGYGRNLLAINTKTKQVRWDYHEQAPLDSRALCMSDGRIYAFRFGYYLTCLDTQTGQVLWKKTKENDPALFDAIGPYLPRQSWQTNWRTATYLKCTKDALYFAGTQMSKLLALSTADGSILWEYPYDNFQLIIRPDALYGISGGTWGENVSKKFDPLTGKILAELAVGRRACTRPTGTCDSILYRAMGGTVRLDLADGKAKWLSPMRPPCHDGVTIANSLLYWWPYVCDCQININGVTCLGAAGDFNFAPDWRSPERLEVASSAAVAEFPARANDWPTFRANPQATATTATSIPAATRILWQTRPFQLPQVTATPPVAAGNLVFLSGSDGVVRALDAVTGAQRWSFSTGSEVRLPPTIWKGRALVGSGDGRVYALEAASGRLLWQFRAAPAHRKIPVYGQLLSTWPVASGVLIENDIAYVAAGLANYDATYVYALDPATGKVQWCNDTSGHLDPDARVGVSAMGHLLAHDGKLYLAGGNAVSPAIYDQRDGRCLNDPAPLAKCESTSPRGWELFLVGDRVIACGKPYYSRPDLDVFDHTVTQKILHTSAGDRDIVWLNNQQLFCFAPIATEVLNRCVSDKTIPQHIIQAWGEFKVDQDPVWGFNTTGGNAIAVTANAIVMAVDRNVVALDIRSGQRLWTHALPAPAVPWGLAVDHDGRAFLTLVDGQVVGVGSPP
ncbi:MAG: outer membrane protein assembly factor BamB family protein [Pirellulaceae bacterium]